jgi:hypothetical protein
VINDVDAGTLQPMISQKVLTGSTVCSDTGESYTGIAARGLSIDLSIMVNDNTPMVKGTISMGLKVSGLFEKKIISKKKVSAEINCISIRKNISGDTLIVQIQQG